MAAKRKLQARDPETGDVYTRTTAANYGVVRILVIPETWDSYDPTDPRRNRIVSWHRDESVATRYDAPSWRNLRHVFAPVTEAEREGVALGDLRTGMDVQAPEGHRRWYRILNIETGTHHRRLADVEVLGGKHAGTHTQITLFDYEAGYKVLVPADAPAEVPVLAEPVMVVPSTEFTAYVTELGRRAKEAGAAVTVVADALPTRDHRKCAPNSHTREAGENTRQRGDQDSDGQLVNSNGDALCNDCEQSLVWCETFEDYVHLDPAAPECFLVHEALPDMECEGCGGVFRTDRWWDGKEIRYADPECAEMFGWTKPPTFAAVVDVARRDSGLTAAEFDYRLTLGSELGAVAYQGLGNAVYRLANEGQPGVTEGAHDVHRDRTNRAAALHTHFAGAIDRMVADAKAKSYTGWATASGGPIQYADHGRNAR